VTTRGCREVRVGRSRAHSAGFTLLELIVAAAILALIAVFSWRGLDTLLREREAIASSQETIDAMQRSFARIERDAMLARDAQLDGSGALRLVSGEAGVEYRLVDGALTRRADGDAAAPMILQAGIAKLVIEAWTAGAKGGWVRVKAAATPPPPPASPPQQQQGQQGQQQPLQTGVAATSNPEVPAPAADNANNPTGNTNPSGGPTVAVPQPIVAAATGIRMSIARVDGTEVVRVFLIGSGG
jgi:prepilin-type N-terminal cleavage/methylation domain-containing protein